jgi:hypothetical protein
MRKHQGFYFFKELQTSLQSDEKKQKKIQANEVYHPAFSAFLGAI